MYLIKKNDFRSVVDWCKKCLEWTTSKQSSYHLVTFRILVSLWRARKKFPPEYFLAVHMFTIRQYIEYYPYICSGPLGIYFEIPRMVNNCTSPDQVIQLQLFSTAVTCFPLCVFYKCIHDNCSKELSSHVVWPHESNRSIRLANKSHFTAEIARYTRIL